MRRTLRALGVVLGAVTLAGCWPMPGANPDRTSFNDVERTITALSVHDLTESWRWTSPFGRISSPVTSTGGVHVASNCWIATLAPGSGEVRWAQPLTTSDVPCSTVGSTTLGEPYVVGSEVIPSLFWSYMRNPGYLEADGLAPHFDVATGQLGTADDHGLVVARRGTESVRSGLGPADPNIASFGLTVADQSIDLWAAPDGGTPFTDVTLGTDKVFHSGYGVMDTEPTGGPGTAHFGSGVQAFSIAESHTGCGPVTWDYPVFGGLYLECPVWATPTDDAPTIPVLSPDGTKVFVRTSAGTLYALDAATGAVLWTAGGLGAAGKPALAQGTLWVPTGTGQVLPFAADGCGAATCEPSLPWSVDTGTGQAVTDVTIVNDVVFAVSAGTVFAVNGCRGGACPVEWSGPGSGPPVVSNGRLYVTDGNATLIAYGLPT